jgi:hypothetical protein
VITPRRCGARAAATPTGLRRKHRSPDPGDEPSPGNARPWRHGPSTRPVCDPDPRPSRRHGAVRVPGAGIATWSREVMGRLLLTWVRGRVPSPATLAWSARPPSGRAIAGQAHQGSGTDLRRQRGMAPSWRSRTVAMALPAAEARIRWCSARTAIVQVHGHPVIRHEHAATDRDYVPPPIGCHAWHASVVTPCKQSRRSLCTVCNQSAAPRIF